MTRIQARAPHAPRFLPATLVGAFALACGGPGRDEAHRQTTDGFDARARRLHASAPVFDGHNDLPGEVRDRGGLDSYPLQTRLDHGHTDIPRLRDGGVGAQFWSAFVPVGEIEKGSSARHCAEQIELIRAMCERHSADFELARTAADVVRIRAAGKIAGLIGIEGGHAIEDSLEKLRGFFDAGARYMTLTHNATIGWADSATDEPRHGGLSEFGVAVVAEMNRLGMLVDISHVSVDTMHDVLDHSVAPVIASHSSAFALCPHPRNVPDAVLERIAANGGLVMVNFAPAFLDPAAARIAVEMYPAFDAIDAATDDESARAKLKQEWRENHPLPPVSYLRVADHIEHIARVAGVDHVGLGSDFDGISAVPVGLEDVSRYPELTAELLRRGWSEADLLQVLGGNALRVLRECEAVARR